MARLEAIVAGTGVIPKFGRALLDEAHLRLMAEHAGAEITEVDASHVSMLSKPDLIVDVIKTAASRIAQPVTA